MDLAFTTPPDATKFNEYFTEVRLNIPQTVVLPEDLLRKIEVSSDVCFQWRPVSESEISKVLSSFKTSRSRDIYEISNVLVKKFISSIALPLTRCINACFRDGIFLHSLKSPKLCQYLRRVTIVM